MTLRHLRIFITVCDENSITAAAEKLYLTQPSVSISIKELELHFGQPLFERVSRKLYITPFGMQVYNYAQRVLTSFNDLENMAQSNQYQNIIRVGTGTAIGSLFMPRVVTNFKNIHPTAQLYVTIDRSTRYPRALCDNALDFVISEKIPETDDLQTISVQSSSIVAVCHKDHPFAQRKSLQAKDFSDADLIIREPDSSTRNALDTFFKSYHVSINPLWESIDVPAIINAVNANLGVGFVATSHIQAVDYPNLVILNVEGLSIRHYVNIYFHKDKQLTPLMYEFINFFIQNYGKEPLSP